MPTVPLSGRTARARQDANVCAIMRIGTGETDTFAIDFTDLAQSGELVSGTPGWAQSTALLTELSEGLSGYVATCKVTAGSTEGECILTCTFTLSDTGRTFKRSIVVQVRTPVL